MAAGSCFLSLSWAWAMATEASSLLEEIADAVLAVGDDGRIRWANRRLAALLGRPPGVVVGQVLAEVIPGARLGHEQRLIVPGEDGVEVPVLVSSRPAGDGDYAVVVTDLRPWLGENTITAATSDEERTVGAVFRETVRASGGEFEGEEDAEAIAQALADQGRRLIPQTDCLIALVDPGRSGVFRVAAGAGPWASSISGHEFSLEVALVSRALTARRSLETTDAQGQGDLGHILAVGGITTARVIPIVADQPLPDGRTALGTIGFYSRRKSAFSEHQRRLMDEFATLVSVSLMRAALRRAARVGEERLQMALGLALDLSRSLDVAEVVGPLLDRALAAAGAQRVVMLRVEGPDTVTEDYRDVDGYPDVIGYRHPIQLQPLMERALSTGAPVTGGRYLSGVFPALLRDALEGVKHTLTVPLLLGSEPVAVLVLSRRVDREFGVDEVATIRLLGGLAALALRNAGLYGQARDANRVKSDFLNMTAHELRTPFTVVAGYISMLQDGSLGEVPPKLERPVETLTTKSRELGRLVEDLLLAARLETGGLPVQQISFDAAAAIAEAVQRATPRSALLAADVQADPPDQPVAALGDPLYVARILDNLVNNALSYARGTPFVRLSVRRTDGWVRLEVEDRGRGIAAVHAQRIFDRFYRALPDDQAAQPGSGLGLYICRQLAARQAGRLELEWSRVGEGSRFVLTLPASTS